MQKINRLRKHNQTNLYYFRTEFYILHNLLKLLIKDRFISIKDKIFLYKLLKESEKREKNITSNKITAFSKLIHGLHFQKFENW